MNKRLFNFCSKTSLVCFETIAVLFLLLGLFVGVFIWRVHTGPFDVGFAKDYIEQALYDPESEFSVTFGGAILQWPDLQGPLIMEITDIGLMQDQREYLNIDTVKLGLSRSALLLGKIKPKSIYLLEPSLRLIRTSENDIIFGLQEERSGMDELNEDDGALERIIDALSSPPGDSEYHSAIDHLEFLEITGARMLMEDHVLGITWFLPNLDLMFARNNQGLATTAKLSLPSGNKASSVGANVTYSRHSNDYRMQLNLVNFDPRILSNKIEALSFLRPHNININGEVRGVLDKTFSLKSASAQINSEKGSLLLEDIYEEPFTYEKIAVNADYSHDKGVLNLEDFYIEAKDVALSLNSEIKISEDEIFAPIKIEIPELLQSEVQPLWPEILKGEPLEMWLTERLSVGRAHDANVSFEILAKEKEQEWDVQVDNIIADFLIENMNVDYRPPLFPISNANGKAHLSNDVITIDIEKAFLADMTIEKGTVAIDHVISEGVGTVSVDMEIGGPLGTLFDYVALEPIEMNDIVEEDKRDEVAGRAALSVGVSLPTSKDVKFEEVDVTVDGRLYEATLPAIVKGLNVTGGPLDLKVGDGQVSISGDAFLAGRPINAKWMEYIETQDKPHKSKVVASFVADKGLRDHFNIDIDSWLDGALPVEIEYIEYENDDALIDVKADLSQVKVMGTPFDYIKKPGEKGAAECKVHIKNGFIHSLSDLKVSSKHIDIKRGELMFKQQGQDSHLVAGRFPLFKLQENDLAVEFEFDNARTMTLKANGPFMDVRSFLGSKKKKKDKYDGPALKAFVDVNKMRTHPERLIGKSKVYLALDKKGEVQQLEMDSIAGKGDIYFRLKPNKEGKLVLRFEAEDAGETLRSFGVYDNVNGGALTVYGEANAPGKRTLYGNAEMRGFKVVNAPAIARLLSVISPAGLPQLLSDEGIHFAKLESRFDWHLRRKGDLYVVSKGRTSGSSLGLTFEGEIDKSKSYMIIKGHIVPVSMVNDILSNIPILGDILSGGSDGGVFAATYEIEGDVKNPETKVNPLSALAPGILRRILFED
jgi:hypothetical protein